MPTTWLLHSGRAVHNDDELVSDRSSPHVSLARSHYSLEMHLADPENASAEKCRKLFPNLLDVQ